MRCFLTAAERKYSLTKKPAFKILFLLFSVSAVILVISIFSPDFSDFFSDKIASAVRLSLAAMSSVVPFSLGETLIILLAAFIILFTVSFFIFIILRKSALFIKLLKVTSVILMTLFILFVFTLGTCYHRNSLFTLMNLDGDSVDNDDVGYTLETLVTLANREAKRINLSHFYNKLSISGLDFATMAQKVNYAANKLADKYDFLQKYGFPAKPIALSYPMTYTHISGVYTFFSGESNVNINYPEYIVVNAIAHEYAHQRGIASENEANFIAFLICLESDVPYIRYAGLANMLYTLSANYYLTDPENCMEIMAELDDAIKREYRLYSDFFEKYSQSPAAGLSDKINDGYLKLNGEALGTSSYNDITKLITAYYIKISK